MVATQERRLATGKEPQRPSGRRLLLVALIVAGLVAAVVGGIILSGGDDGEAVPVTTSAQEGPANPQEAPAAQPGPAAVVSEPGSPEWVMERLIGALEGVEGSQLVDLSAPLDGFGTRFLEWNLAAGMEPEFSDCMVSTRGTVASAVCTVEMGEDYFFSRVLGTNTTTSISTTVSLSSGEITVQGWPPPTGLVEIERDLREWIRATHPDDEDLMFGFDFAGIVKFSKQAGELHTQHAEEYLAYIAEPRLTPEDVLDRLTAAIQASDPVAYADIYPSEGDRSLLVWHIALKADPEFSDCTPLTQAGRVRCTADMGPDFFYNVVAGEDLSTDVRVRIQGDDGASPGQYVVTSFGPASGITTIELDMKRWIQENHPELEDRMFGDTLGLFRFTKDSGELHMQYLDEFLEFRASLEG